MRAIFFFTLAAAFLGPLLGPPVRAVPLRTFEPPETPGWSCWRGPNRDNICLEKGLLRSWPAEGPPLLWKAKEVNGGTCCGIGYSSLSLQSGMLFTMGDRQGQGHVFCYDARTGRELWATPAFLGNGAGPNSTPTVDGERVYALTPQGVLLCLDRAYGAIVWQKDFKQEFGGKMMSGWGYSESVLIDGDKLLCAPGGPEAAVVALNKRTGAVLWKTPIEGCGGAGYSSFVVAHAGGVRQYVTLLSAREGLVGVDSKTGKLLWNYKRISNGTANMVTPIVHDDLVFASSGYNVGTMAVQITPEGQGRVSSKEVYVLPGNTLQCMHGSMVLVNGYVYGGHGHNQGQPFCLELKTGKLAWGPIAPAPTEGSATVLYADGHLYFRYQNNVMALVEATPLGYHLKGRFDLPKDMGVQGWQQTLIHDGKMYLRGRDQILCYDVKQATAGR